MRELRRTRWMCGLVLALGCGDAGDPGTASQASASSGGVSPTSGGVDETGSETGGETGVDPEPTDGEGSASGEAPTTGVAAMCTQDAECGQGVGVCQQGVCDGGVCAVVDVAKDTTVDDAPGDCRRTVCDGAGATKEVPADDDVPPGVPGDCKVATCVGGRLEFAADDLDLPDDGIECTQDGCEQGTPAFVPRPVNSFCGPGGAQFCHDDLGCRDCEQVSAACEDGSMTEANETQLASHKLGTINDADASGKFVCAVLDGAADVDWYTFNGNDAFLNFVDPTREVITDQEHEICVYITCDNGAPQIGCGGDETEDVAPMGQPGCCGTGNVSPSLNCAGTDDSATIWIKVENVGGLDCVPYQLKYHF